MRCETFFSANLASSLLLNQRFPPLSLGTLRPQTELTLTARAAECSDPGTCELASPLRRHPFSC